MACSCIYATAKNSLSVRSGHEMGGYLMEECAECKAEREKLDEAYASADAAPAEQYNRDLRALVVAARAVTNGAHFGSPAAMKQAHGFLAKALDQFEPWLDEENGDDPRANGWVDDKGRP